MKDLILSFQFSPTVLTTIKWKRLADQLLRTVGTGRSEYSEEWEDF